MLSRGTKPQPQFTSMNVERSAHERSAALFPSLRSRHRGIFDGDAFELLVAEHTPSCLQRNPGLGVRGSDLTALSDAQTISDDVEFPPGSLLYASTLRFGAHTLAQMVGVW